MLYAPEFLPRYVESARCCTRISEWMWTCGNAHNVPRREHCNFATIIDRVRLFRNAANVKPPLSPSSESSACIPRKRSSSEPRRTERASEMIYETQPYISTQDTTKDDGRLPLKKTGRPLHNDAISLSTLRA